MGATCSVEDCLRPAFKGGLCHGHIKRRQRGQVVCVVLGDRHESPLECLRESALAYAGADSEEAFKQADDRLEKAALRLAQERGWRRCP